MGVTAIVSVPPSNVSEARIVKSQIGHLPAVTRLARVVPPVYLMSRNGLRPIPSARVLRPSRPGSGVDTTVEQVSVNAKWPRLSCRTGARSRLRRRPRVIMTPACLITGRAGRELTAVWSSAPLDRLIDVSEFLYRDLCAGVPWRSDPLRPCPCRGFGLARPGRPWLLVAFVVFVAQSGVRTGHGCPWLSSLVGNVGRSPGGSWGTLIPMKAWNVRLPFDSTITERSLVLSTNGR